MTLLTRTIPRFALAAMLLVGTVLWLRPAHTARASTSGVVISQVYGGGGNAGAPFTHDFIELFNAESIPVNLSGWSVQYASAAGNGNFGATTGQLTPLPAVTLAPGQYLLIQEAIGTTVPLPGSPLPTADVTDGTAINMSGTAGKVALVTTTVSLGCNGNPAPSLTPCDASQLAQIVDLVGYGNTATFFEGAGAAPNLSNTTAGLRAANGCTDSNNNNTDFAAGAPTPRNMASPLNPCVVVSDTPPSVSGSVPANGAMDVALDASITVNFSEDVTLSDGWFALSCLGSGVHSATVTAGANSATIDPDSDFIGSDACTLTIFRAGVSDIDGIDPANMSADVDILFTAVSTTNVCGAPATPIHAVQGSDLISPLSGNTVTVEGVVVGDYQTSGGLSGFFVQEEDADADTESATSEGLFVFDGGSPAVNVQVGDRVRVTGAVSEFGTPSLTEITSFTGVVVCGTEALPSPQTVSLPFANANDPEPYEGMLVTLPQTLVATEVFNIGRFGEIMLASQRHPQPTHIALPGIPANAVAAANLLNRIILDDGRSGQNPDPTPYFIGTPPNDITLRDGDSITGLTGVMHQAFGAYRIQPFNIGSTIFSATNPRPAAPEPVGGTLRVASFNVLNFFNGDGLGGGFPTPRGANTLAEFERQRAKTVAAITMLDADVIGLMEMENDAAGPNSAIQNLVETLNAATAPNTYAYIDTGVVGTDEIRVAILYKPSRVEPIGPWAIKEDGSFAGFSRPPIAQTFKELSNGEQFIFVVNHFKSKGSCPSTPISDPDQDQNDQQGCWNAKRVVSATELLGWLATDPTGTGDSDVLLMGDFNAYALENPIATLEAGGFTDMAKAFHGTDAYSYVFSGAAGYLDYALASADLATRVTGVTDWHINTDEPTVLDYNMEFKSPAQQMLNLGTPYRASDHDPVLVGLQLGDSVTPGTIDFGNQRVGMPSAAQSFTVKNSASGSITLGALSIGAPFALSADTCSGATLLPGETCTVDATFTPTAVGAAGGSLAIPSNAVVPIGSVALSGIGIAPNAVLDQTSLTFGTTNVGSSSPAQDVTLTNTGSDTLNISSIAVSVDFTASNTCGTTLGVGASCTISVQFAPTTVGSLTGSLTVSSDATPVSIPLAGTAVVPPSNLLKNGSFERNRNHDRIPDFWSSRDLHRHGFDGQDCSSSAVDGRCTLRLSGYHDNEVKQRISINGSAGDAHSLTFWARGSHLVGYGQGFRVVVTINYRFRPDKTFVISLPNGTTAWTQYSLSFVTQGSYNQITVEIEGGKAHGTLWLDNFFLQ